MEERDSGDGGRCFSVEADDGGVDFGPWIEAGGRDREGAVDGGVELDEEGEGAKGFGAGSCGHAVGDLFLHHDGDGGKGVLKELFEDGRCDVVREIGDDFDVFGESFEGEFEKIGSKDVEAAILEAGELFCESVIHFHSVDVGALFEEFLSEKSGAGADF